MSGKWHLRADASWRALAPADPEAVMALTATDMHVVKQGRAISRWSPGGRLVVYVKRHFRESPWRGLLAAITRRPSWSAAWQEFRNIRWASDAGIPVPRPAALGVRVGPGTSLAGFLAIEELTGQRPLHELIPIAHAALSPAKFHMWKRGLVAELARLARELHIRRRFHKDLYLCHFFAPERFATQPPARWIGQVSMIDFHRLNHHPVTWRWWQLKDLAQLLYSSEVPGVTARDRLRFWKLYAGRRRKLRLGRLVKKLVLVRWRNYRGHNAHRQRLAA